MPQSNSQPVPPPQINRQLDIYLAGCLLKWKLLVELKSKFGKRCWMQLQIVLRVFEMHVLQDSTTPSCTTWTISQTACKQASSLADFVQSIVVTFYQNNRTKEIN